MEQKTVIQELWDDIAKFGFKSLENKQEYYLEKEKNQITDAYYYGAIEFDGHSTLAARSCKQYYNEVFSKDEKQKCKKKKQ